ncbi:MAG TPA: hypothetical protein VFE47_17195 [Tepidisphaeraceae bacterium]|jgi:hypothetical protein|nr:hypothetical protein [Tepidisphaeraceae bacterium]
MRVSLRMVLCTAGGSIWAAGVAFGLWRFWQYEQTPGRAARPVATLPADEQAPAEHRLPTLLLSIHPQCPCSRATISELDRLMAECQGKVRAVVLMERPAGMPPGWEQSDLWRSAAAIRGVTVQVDPDGARSRRLGALTSGQAFLYSADGKLLFTGGITESRGHAGDNAGRSAIAAIVLGSCATPAVPVSTPVFGCPLFEDDGVCQNATEAACPK